MKKVKRMKKDIWPGDPGWVHPQQDLIDAWNERVESSRGIIPMKKVRDKWIMSNS